MKKCTDMLVKSVHEIALETVEMTLADAFITKEAAPGQFLHLLVDGHSLRRPISITDIDRNNETVTILFKKTGEGTRRLASLQPGSTVNAIGPAGNGFSYDSSIRTALLIGGGIGIPPLYCLGRELLQNGINVKAVLGFQTKQHVFYEEKFKMLGGTYVVTDDGSYGHKGFVTDGLDFAGHFDHYYSCGPIPMLRAVTNELTYRPGSISLEERLGCGIGACFACVIQTDNAGGYRKICSDGPVFAAGEVVL
ncbi:dihydroorotate oxidase B, electron transfer subunit [Lentibacillus persicus]|uniref:Dihydroorotate dehydrogenase B (NAD(+)), electron transfer subunit n=1 Tax=Lentibacillus persicus TaxID=640948 RepID=A0A1I1VGD4_9BACI|nr:dihydroorotate dehydrogenase electron transfer subunit [Lentibacillus persicus]SFD82057.1 dihydroorotate oxidase B, electron transfer subunit [Lentibacillus persicus]